MGWITFLKSLGASVPTPATDQVSLFVDDSTGEPSYKDDTGAVNSLVGPAGPAAPSTVTIVTEAGTSTMDPATHAGTEKYIRCSGDVTFNVAETYVAGQVYNIRAVTALELLETGVTLTEPFGGTLELDAGMSVSVIMTSASAGDVIGQTVPL